ncbi:hypothetical protein OBBRIDRAFT_734332 [Obba rivulosa]|uniref:BBC1/AIM3 cysteine proteinase-fold domain-containing protein n=1 Tax=Obba rivulosa TaxID=1052685 RepID=A0A8E2AUS8_9APHY|nr:hypothetical protein OBBRIDRAFT_734332 [Obba rivulosa]
MPLDLKDRASKAKDFTSSKLSNTRDRYSSQSSKNINWNATIKPPPPPPSKPPALQAHLPPPSRTHNRNDTTPPPLVRKDTRPDSVSPAPPAPYRATSAQVTSNRHSGLSVGARDRIDWANLSSEDKNVFFSWLDEFFGRYFGRPVGPPADAKEKAVDASPTAPASTPRPTVAVVQGPHGSAAADLAHYFTPSVHWDSPWYTSSNPMPAPIAGSSQIAFTASWQMHGGTKTLYAGVLFSDLSMCWFSVQFPSSPTDPNDLARIKRSAQFLPRPGPLDVDTLVAAHETYGEAVAASAEEFVRTRTVCDRGECWDLASFALRQFEQWPQIPRPVPSISRTHGHLIFEGRATGRGQSGRWRGGDNMVRRGDIVEWRSVRLTMGGGAFAILGNPDHTAVIVADTVPRVSVADGQSVKPAEIGTLEVVEQSAGKLPARASYDLSGLEEGEVWIYRPVSMLEYVGALLEPHCPDGVNALTL